jgi:hypothetical protein
MASTPTFSPNPYANFDPSQWQNPYSNYQNSALPFPSSYAGWPTDAMGNPIQPQPGSGIGQPSAAAAAAPAATPGTTLNSTPYTLPQGLSPQQQRYDSNAYNNMIGAQMSEAFPQQNMATTPAAAAAPAANPSGLTSQQYLQLLAHPNPVQTPGATVPQSAQSYQPSNGVLQQFLANWKPAQSGPGSGFQQGFNKALRSS